jgi:hypothetical protein
MQKHLDIAIDLENRAGLYYAGQGRHLICIIYVAHHLEFIRMNDFRAPRDKLICILNACKIILGTLLVS